MSKFRIKKTQGLLDSLEDQLVKEFRSCQSLYILTKEERLALSLNNVQDLSSLVERKLALVDELVQLEQARHTVTREMGDALGLKHPSPGVSDILSSLDQDAAHRLSRLLEGILAVTGYVRDLTQGNQALTETALEQTHAAQAFLLDLNPSLSSSLEINQENETRPLF
ncbi:MAG TPA: flagellar protein FlgN [Anaerolineales bacterium]